MLTYLFYDLETSGLNKCFDQVLQFAAIRTDEEFHELERHNIFVKLNPDLIPSPAAFITHQISLDKLQTCGILELAAVEKIHALLNVPGTISVGYNSLGFDDKFLRFSFYRNLLPPYTHQYANNCGRMDLYPITVLYYLYNKKILHWPENEHLPSLKLEFLSALNCLHSGISHDALADTEAIVELAKRFRSDKKMWDYACGYFDKNIDTKRVRDLPDLLCIEGQKYKHGIMLDGVFGAGQSYQCPVLNLGWHNHYKNQTLWLRLDQEKLFNTTFDSIPETTYVYRKKIGETGFLLPPVDRFMHDLCAEKKTIYKKNKHWLEKNPNLLQAISSYHCEYEYPLVPDVDLDARLYLIEFLQPYEERLCKKFHAGDLQSKLAMLSEFKNDNLRARAVRILGRNYGELLPEEIAYQYKTYLAQALQDDTAQTPRDYRGIERLKPKAALQQIADLRRSPDHGEEKIKILDALEAWITAEILRNHTLNSDVIF